MKMKTLVIVLFIVAALAIINTQAITAATATDSGRDALIEIGNLVSPDGLTGEMVIDVTPAEGAPIEKRIPINAQKGELLAQSAGFPVSAPFEWKLSIVDGSGDSLLSLAGVADGKNTPRYTGPVSVPEANDSRLKITSTENPVVQVSLAGGLVAFTFNGELNSAAGQLKVETKLQDDFDERVVAGNPGNIEAKTKGLAITSPSALFSLSVVNEAGDRLAEVTGTFHLPELDGSASFPKVSGLDASYIPPFTKVTVEPILRASKLVLKYPNPLSLAGTREEKSGGARGFRISVEQVTENTTPERSPVGPDIPDIPLDDKNVVIKVKNESGGYVANATVKVDGSKKESAAAKDGIAAFALPAGSYIVTASAPAFRSATLELVVNPGTRAEKDVILKAAPQALPEVIRDIALRFLPWILGALVLVIVGGFVIWKVILR